MPEPSSLCQPVAAFWMVLGTLLHLAILSVPRASG